MKSSRVLGVVVLTAALTLSASPAFAQDDSDPTSFVNENSTTTSVGGSLASTGSDESQLTDLLLVGGIALAAGAAVTGVKLRRDAAERRALRRARR